MPWKPWNFNPAAVVRSLVLTGDGKNEIAFSPLDKDYTGRLHDMMAKG